MALDLRHTPSVRIGGVPVPCDEFGVEPPILGLAGIVIDWGRTDLYAHTDPTTVTLELLDDDGRWSADTSRFGEVLEIVLPSGRVLFRGTITETSMTLTTISTTDDGNGRDVWKTTIDAVDVLADLDRDLLKNDAPEWGPIINPPIEEKAGAVQAGWNTVTGMVARAWGGGMNRYAGGYTNPPSLSGMGSIRVALYTTDAVPTYLEMLYAQWRVVPFVTVAYKPDTDRIAGIEPAAVVNLDIVLSYSATTDTITIAAVTSGGGVAPITLDACRLEVTDVTLHSTVQSAITQLEIPHQFMVFKYSNLLNNGYQFSFADWRDNTDQYPVASARIARTVSIPLNAIPTDTRTFPTLPPGSLIPDIASPPTGAPLTTVIGPRWVAAIQAVNGKMTPPETTYHVQDWPADTATENFLLTLYPQSRAVYLSGSATAGIPNAPAVVEIIGGQLTWDGDGWHIGSRYAPTAGTVRAATLTISTLVTNPVPGFDDYDPAIRLLDLGMATIGVS